MEHPTRIDAPAEIAGFWRRLFAFVIDCLILGAFGWLCTHQFADQLIRFGSNARVFGVVVALMYFGVLNSRLGGGASLGKRILGLRVVGRDGARIAPAHAFVRAALFVVPLYLNGWMFALPPLSRPAQIAFTTVDFVLVFGVLFANLYLLIANTGTRQLVHDLFARTYVIKADSLGAETATRTAGVHLAVIGVWFALFLIGIPAGWSAVERFAGSNPFGLDLAGMTKVYDSVLQEPGVQAASVQTTFFTSWVNGQKRSETSLAVLVYLNHAPGDAEAKALRTRIAMRALKIRPDIFGREKLSVTVRYGYDVGIFRDWNDYHYADTPAGWKALAAPAGKP